MIKPALTAEEWEAVRAGGHVTGGYSLDYDATITTHGEGRGAILGYDERHKDLNSHAAAAYTLYGQPFGFTREDASRLRDWRNGGIGPDHAEWSRSFLDRIEALLPPEKA